MKRKKKPEQITESKDAKKERNHVMLILYIEHKI